jgi:DNA-binding HxlR family transcriptional regulator
MIRRTKKLSTQPQVTRMVEDMVGCKWSLAVLGRIRAGVQRPGEIERAIDGISKKVMNERLRKLQRYGIVDKRIYAEVPPRVEYRLTGFGTRFARILDGIERLQRALDDGPVSPPRPKEVAETPKMRAAHQRGDR